MLMVHNEKKQQSLVNFKKARGQIDNIISMIERDEYCIDIMTQNLAAIGLLKSAHQIIMEGHLNSCFLGAMESSDMKVKQEKIEEILRVTKLCSK